MEMENVKNAEIDETQYSVVTDHYAKSFPLAQIRRSRLPEQELTKVQ